MISSEKKTKNQYWLNTGYGNPWLNAAVYLLQTVVVFVTCLFIMDGRFPRSLADCFVLINYSFFPFFTFCLPLFILYIQNLLRNDQISNFVLHCQSRAQLWNNQSVKIAIHSFLFSLHFTAVILLYGWLYGVKQINWAEDYSNYFLEVHATNTVTSFSDVVLMFFLGCFVCFMACAFLFNLLLWVCRFHVVAWFAVLLVGCWDFYSTRLPIGGLEIRILIGLTSLEYDLWKGHRIITGILWVWMISLVLYGLGRFFCRRKEFCQ